MHILYNYVSLKKMAVAVVFDFDSTIVRGKARSKYDLEKLFGGHERILMLIQNIRKINADLYICSGNNEQLIRKILDDLRGTGYDLDSTKFKEIIGGVPDEKYEIINKWALEYDTVVFIDDTASNYEGVAENVITIPMNGITPMNEEHLSAILTASTMLITPNTTPKRTKRNTPSTPGTMGDMCITCGLTEALFECDACAILSP
jgi:hypothetical protein